MQLAHFLVIGITLFVSSCGAVANGKNMEKSEGLYANIVTTKGDILVNLEWEEAPLSVLNFVGLAKGILKNTSRNGPYYDGLTFHRVIPNFMIQGGDPTGLGSGGPGYRFPDEISSKLKHDKEGILSLANCGPNTNGSQFFITLEATPWLDGKHTVFGEVVKGMDVVKKIAQGDSILRIQIIANGSQAEGFEISQKHFDKLYAQAWQKQKEEEEKFLDSQRELALSRFKNKDDIHKSDNGVYYCILTEGSGPNPKSGQTIEVHYAGYLLSGVKFDSSYERKESFKFVLEKDRLIPGWEAQLKEMKVGEKRQMIIPPHLAYGERGIPGAIPPNSFLDFTVELISVK